MNRRVRHGFAITTIALLTLLLLFIGGVVPINLTPLKVHISAMLLRSTGLAVAIHERVELRLGVAPELKVAGIELLSGEGEGQFLRLSDLSLQLEAAKLLGGELSFREILLDELTVDRCQAVPATAFGGSESASGPVQISVHRLSVTQLEIVCAEDGEDALKIYQLEGDAVGGQDLSITADLNWRSQDITLDLAGGALDELLASGSAYPFTLQAEATFASIELSGAVEEAFKRPRLDGLAQVTVGEPDALLALFEADALGLPELALRGKFGYSGNRVSLDGMSGLYDSAPWLLTASLDWGAAKPLLVLDTQLDQFDLGALLPSAASQAVPKTNDQWRLAEEIPLDFLDRVDAQVDLRLTGLQPSALPISDIGMRLEIEAGQGQLDLVYLQSSLASASGHLSLDRGTDCPSWDVSLNLSGIDLVKLDEFTGIASGVNGLVDKAAARMQACGASLQSIRDNLVAVVTADALEIQPAVDQPTIKVQRLRIESGWQRNTLLEAAFAIEEQRGDVTVEAGEVALLASGGLWPITLQMTADNANLAGRGSVMYRGDQSSAQAELQFKSSGPGILAPLLGLNPQYSRAIAFDMTAALDAAMLDISTFKLSLNRSDVSGALQLQLAEGPVDSEFVLRSRLFDMKELDQILPKEEAPQEHVSSPERREWPTVRLDLAFDEVRGPERVWTDVQLKGLLLDDRIRGAELGLALEAFSLTGTLDADFGQLQPRIAMSTTMHDVDLGRILRVLDLAEDTIMHAQEVSLLLTTSGWSRRELADNLELDFGLQQLHWLVQSQASAEEIRVSIDEVNGVARPGVPISMDLGGYFNEVPVNIFLQTSALGQTLDPMAKLPIRAVLGTDRETVMFDGVWYREQELGLRASLQLSAMRRVVAPGQYSALKAPLPGVVIGAEIDLAADETLTVDVDASLASSRLGGRITSSKRGVRNRFGIELSAPHLQTADFSPLVVTMEEGRGKNTTSKDSAADQSSFLDIIDDYLSGMPALVDFDIALQVEELMADQEFLGAADLQAIIEGQNLELGKLKLTLPGGDVDLNYTMSHVGDDIHTRLDAHIENFEMSGLFKTLDPASKAGGLLYLDTSLDAVASTTDGLAAASRGHFDLALFPRDVSANVLDLWATNVILALMPRVKDDSEDINCVVARFEVNDGVMNSKQIMLDSDDIIVRGRGTIDLGQSELDLVFAPQAKRERFFSVSSPMEVTGPFDDFDVSMVRGGLIGTGFRWYLSLVYVPWKWLTGERFPKDGTPTCLNAMGWDPDPGTGVAPGLLD